MVPLIPGAYERNTLTHRQPGAMGAAPSDTLPASPWVMDTATIAEREREGGGAARERQPPVPSPSSTGPALRHATPHGSWLTGSYLWFQLLRLARR